MTGPDLPADPADGRPLTSELARLLGDWLPRQRWFGGRAAQAVTITTRHVLPGDLPAEVVIAAADGAHYLVPISWYRQERADKGHALIGSTKQWSGYDGLRDGAIIDRLYRVLAGGERWGPVRGRPVGVLPADLPGLSPELEQSNTSLIFGDQIMVKFFRQLAAGINPDAEVTEQLATCAHTADPAGELRIDLLGVDTTMALATGYLRNCVDGWSVATASVRNLLAEHDLAADEVGGDFAPESHRLGAAVAAVHDALLDGFGAGGPEGGDRLIGIMREEAAGTCRSIAELQPLRESVVATFDHLRATLSGTAIQLQRIHGDLHLGQTLRAVDRWIVIDFEGEPSRPPAERRAMAPAVRDIAGMLRSFDYAAHHQLQFGTHDGHRVAQAAGWALRNQRAFLEGYRAVRPLGDAQTPLLRAYELAKAVYEVRYEARHRPEWQSIPLAAVRRLVSPNPG